MGLVICALPIEIYSQRKNLAAASPNATAQPAMASSCSAVGVERVAVARDNHDIAPVDDVADIGQVIWQVLGERQLPHLDYR